MTNKLEQLPQNIQPKTKFIDNPDEYEHLHEEKGAGILRGEALRLLKPAFNTKNEIYIYKPTFESIENYDPDYIQWVIEHETLEQELDNRTRTGNLEDASYLHSLGLPEKQEDEEAFFEATHKYAINKEINNAIQAGKVRNYLTYLKAYLQIVEQKINRGEIKVPAIDYARFRDRQEERIVLLEKYLYEQHQNA